MFPKSSNLMFLVVTFALLTPGWSTPKALGSERPVVLSAEALQALSAPVQGIIDTLSSTGGVHAGTVAVQNPLIVRGGLTYVISFTNDDESCTLEIPILISLFGGDITLQCGESAPVTIPLSSNILAIIRIIINIIGNILG